MFFLLLGTFSLSSSWLDQVVVLGLGMGIVTDPLTNNVLRFISSADKEYYPYMMFETNKYWTFIANIIYAAIILFIVINIYRLLHMNVEPILFGILYTAVDMLFIKAKGLILKAAPGKD